MTGQRVRIAYREASHEHGYRVVSCPGCGEDWPVWSSAPSPAYETAAQHYRTCPALRLQRLLGELAALADQWDPPYWTRLHFAADAAGELRSITNRYREAPDV